MNRLKNFKNYLTSSTAASGGAVNPSNHNTSNIQQSPEIESNVSKSESKYGIRKTSVDSIVFTNTISSISSHNNEDNDNGVFVKIFNLTKQQQNKINNADLHNHPKILRSKSIEERSVKLKKSNSNGNNNNNNSGNKKNEAELSGIELFAHLEKKIDLLIEHFKPSTPSEPLDQPLAQSITPNSAQQFLPLMLPTPLYLETSDASSSTYFKLALHVKLSILKCVAFYSKLAEKCSLFDYDSGISESVTIESNGYRSIMKTFEMCCKRTLIVVNELNEKKSSFLFQKLPGVSSSLKEFQAWVRLIEKFEIILQTALDMQTISLANLNIEAGERPSLFIDSKQMTQNDSSIETNLFYLGSIYQESFFGRSCGFQFCDSLQIPLTGCAVALASYNDGYEAYSNKENNFTAGNGSNLNTQTTPTKKNSPTTSINLSPTSFSGQATLFKSLFSGTKYILDPELRAKKITRVIKDANVDFCKAFWQLTETSIVQMGSNLVTPQLAVNVMKKISLALPLHLPRIVNGRADETGELVTINPPQSSNPGDSVQIRLLSSEMRVGMQELDNIRIEAPSMMLNNFISFPTNLNSFQTTTQNSPYLILHVHGGGFIAHSSKSHEIYLKPWCKELKIPIVSIDYSLAPEHAFPRGSEECFYVYAWCLLNKTSLGWTGEKIICVGDSAGGVLVTNIVQRAIKSQIRVPDALIPIYTPFLLTYSLSPSRLMSVMDPLLNLGILWRCLAAYCGIDFKSETEKFKTLLKLNDLSPTIDSPNKSKSSSPQKSALTKSMSLRAFLSRSINSASSNDQNRGSVSSQSNRESPSPDLYSGDESNDEAKLESSMLKSISNTDFSSKISANHDTASTMDTAYQKRLLQLHKLLGDSVFLVERLRENPLTQNEYMSPILSDPAILAKFPPTFLITASQDPLLDDNIEFNQMLKSLNVPCRLNIKNGLHHGFLNFVSASKDCYRASKYVSNVIKIAIGSTNTTTTTTTTTDTISTASKANITLMRF